MKNLITAHLIILLTVFSSLSQWQSDLRLTNYAGSSITTHGKCIASENSYLHTAWCDNRDGNYEIYYKRSTDNGQTWSSDQRLTSNSAASTEPCISSYGSNVHILFNDERSGYFEIYYMRSTNNGTNWSTAIRVSDDDTYHSYSAYIYATNYIYAAWLDEYFGDLDIYYSRSSNNGYNWSAPVSLTNGNLAQKYPAISSSGSNVHIVYEDERASLTNTEIYYRRSTNSGVNWDAEIRLTNNSAQSWNPHITSEGNSVYVVFDDDRTGNHEIYFKRSTNNGINWSSDAILTINSASSGSPAISVSGIYTHIVWGDSRDGNSEIYYKFSTNSGSSWGSDTRLTNNSGESRGANVCLSGNVVNVLWYDDRNGNNEIYYKRNPTGNPTGIEIISSEIPERFSLSQNFPNPFNPTTNFEFTVPNRGFVNVTIFDAMGRVVETLVNEELKPGTYEAEWRASKFSSGVYFYKLTSGDFSETKRMVMIK